MVLYTYRWLPPYRMVRQLIDQGYLEEVCVASESISYDVSVSGSTTRSSRNSRRRRPVVEGDVRRRTQRSTVPPECHKSAGRTVSCT